MCGSLKLVSRALQRAGGNTSAAHELECHPGVWDTVISSLERDVRLGDRPVHDPVKQLLVPALLQIANDPTRIVFILDALDECDNQYEVHALLNIIVPILCRSGGRHRLFITCRPEHTLLAMLDDVFSETRLDQRQTLRLHQIEKSIVQGDIMTFYEHSFRQIRATHPSHGHIALDWPTASTKARLVDRTGTFFIFAATVVRWVSEPYAAPATRLAQFLSDSAGVLHDGPNTSPYAHLDELYLNILAKFTSGDRRQLRLVLTTITLAFEPLSTQSICHLLEVDTASLVPTLYGLSSILLLPDNLDAELDTAITTFRPSFPDFVTNPDRCHDVQFFVCRPEYHG